MTDHQVEKVLQKYVDLIMGKDVYMTPPRAGKCLNMQIRQSNLSLLSSAVKLPPYLLYNVLYYILYY